MDFCNRSAGNIPTCFLDRTFQLVGRVHELSNLEEMSLDVSGVRGFHVRGEPTPDGGTEVVAHTARSVKERIDPPRRRAEDESGDELDQLVDSDCNDDPKKVVDTDDDSDGSWGSSESDSGPFGKDLTAPLLSAPAATGAGAIVGSGPAVVARSGKEPLWEDLYFWVWDNRGDELGKLGDWIFRGSRWQAGFLRSAFLTSLYLRLVWVI